jgi:hypothetical protein
MRLRSHNGGLLLLVFILPLLWGCPYESKVPLCKSTKAEIDQQLLGKWENKGQDSGTMIIQQFNDHELLILAAETRKGVCDCEAMRAFVTVVQGERFLNVQEIKASEAERGWYLVHYAVSGETLTARVVDDKLITTPVTSSRALYRFIKHNLHDKALYGDDAPLVFQRVKK